MTMLELCTPRKHVHRRNQLGFSLIEMIGVATVLALLALALTPILIKQFDRIAGEKEVAQLRAFTQAFREGVAKTKTIPDQNGWDSMIATNLGLNRFQVRTNERRVQRVFMVDPLFSLGGAVLPYSQTMAGASNTPVNPRIMVLSSLSQTIPSISGPAYFFDDLWNSPDGQLPSWLVTSLAWTGKPEDLKIQRIHLGNMFVNLILSKGDSNAFGRYSIDGSTPTAPPPPRLDAYFIDGTRLELYDASSGQLELGEILHGSKSFESVLGSWRAERFLGRTIQHPTALDLELAAKSFLTSMDNPGRKIVGGIDPTTYAVHASMISYMSNYVTWARASTPFSYAQGQNSTYAPMLAAQTDMANITKNQIDKQ
jgi:type II secretory pathway pseudopilin PulG